MDFFDAPLRRLRFVKAWGLLAVALVVAPVPSVLELDQDGSLICYTGAGFCLVLGLISLWLARRTAPDAIVTKIPQRAPVPEQIRYYRRALWLSAIAFPLMTVWLAYDLQQLESGAVKSVHIWWPLVPIYEHFGYWPTVLSLISLSVGCCRIIAFKIRKLASKQS